MRLNVRSIPNPICNSIYEYVLTFTEFCLRDEQNRGITGKKETCEIRDSNRPYADIIDKNARRKRRYSVEITRNLYVGARRLVFFFFPPANVIH